MGPPHPPGSVEERSASVEFAASEHLGTGLRRIWKTEAARLARSLQQARQPWGLGIHRYGADPGNLWAQATSPRQEVRHSTFRTVQARRAQTRALACSLPPLDRPLHQAGTPDISHSSKG